MSRQEWNETVAVAGTSGAAIANSTAETILFPDYTIHANTLKGDKTFFFWGYGEYSTTGTPTLIFAVRLGGVAGTLIMTTAACTTPSGVSHALWEMVGMIQVRSNGSSGTVMGNGKVTVFAGVAGTVASSTGAALVTPMTAGGVLTPAPVSLDLTADQALSFTGKWSAASSSNTTTGLNLFVDEKN